jgi:hypothetical protein
MNSTCMARAGASGALGMSLQAQKSGMPAAGAASMIRSPSSAMRSRPGAPVR